MPTFLQSLIYIFSWILFKLFCRFSVHGLEHVKNLPRGVIFAANHTSEWDGILIRVALPFFWRLSPMYYVAMTKNGYTNSGWRQLIYGGTLFRLLGAYPVYTGKKDYEYSLQNYLEILRQKKSVCIFPEGARTKDGKLGEARGGVGYLVNKTSTPVVPVTICGLVRLKVSDIFTFKRHVSITFHPVMQPNEVFPEPITDIDDYRKGSVRIMERIAHHLSC